MNSRFSIAVPSGVVPVLFAVVLYILVFHFPGEIAPRNISEQNPSKKSRPRDYGVEKADLLFRSWRRAILVQRVARNAVLVHPFGFFVSDLIEVVAQLAVPRIAMRSLCHNDQALRRLERASSQPAGLL
jgi:hypothetical protein